MKKYLRSLLLVPFLLFYVQQAKSACNGCGYVGSNQVISFNTIYNLSGPNGTLATNLWDEATFKNGIFFGFPFKMCGQTFTMCNANSNGYIWFGSGNAP